MAKVSFVKWSQKWIFVDRSTIPGIAKYLENCRFQCNFNIFGCARNGTSVNKNWFLRPLNNRYFCQNALSKIFLFLACFPINSQNLQPPEGKKKLWRLKRQFWKWQDQGNNLEECRSCNSGKSILRIGLVCHEGET